MADPRRAALYATLAETYAALARLEAEDAGVSAAGVGRLRRGLIFGREW